MKRPIQIMCKTQFFEGKNYLFFFSDSTVGADSLYLNRLIF